MTTTLDVLIHVADGMLYDQTDYGRALETRLTAAGLRWSRHALTESERPWPAARAHLLTGGQTSVRSDTPWMQAAIVTAGRLIAEAATEHRPVVGICLGSQILAEALCPGVVKPADRIEVGLVGVNDTDRGRLIVTAFHYEQIDARFATVPGVRITGTNSHSPVQSFDYGAYVHGYQYHPELTATDLTHIIRSNRAVILDHGGNIHRVSRTVERHAGHPNPWLFQQLVVDRLLPERRAA